MALSNNAAAAGGLLSGNELPLEAPEAERGTSSDAKEPLRRGVAVSRSAATSMAETRSDRAIEPSSRSGANRGLGR